MPTAAELLEGMKLGAWTVIKKITKPHDHTGGNFSVGYIVRSDSGEEAFLKALDFQKLITSRTPDPAGAMKILTESYVFERDLLRKCSDEKLRRIIRFIEDGSIDVNGFSVPYIIFELAKSDVRREYSLSNDIDLAWVLRSMHNVSAALAQIHSRDITHQDLKPSNVLITVTDERKLGDFGRSVTKTCTLPHAGLTVPGDRNHAAPEALFGYSPAEWNIRRLGYDVYQLGNLFVFLITKVPATTLLISFLRNEHRPENWGGTYQAVLPYLSDAFSQLVGVFEAAYPDDTTCGDASQLVQELCNPDIGLRGDGTRKARGANPFVLERYISRFDRLAKKIELQLRAKV